MILGPSLYGLSERNRTAGIPEFSTSSPHCVKEVSPPSSIVVETKDLNCSVEFSVHNPKLLVIHHPF